MYQELQLELTKGEIPLLTKTQLKFLDDVHEVLQDEVSKSFDWFVPEDDDDLLKAVLQVSAAEENLNTIMKHIREGRLAKLLFAETYPLWKRNRDDCIVKLQDIAESLNYDRFNCNVAKLVGYCTSFVGGGITLASAILIPFSFGLTTPLAIAGGTITAAGCSTAIGTSITEVALLKKNTDKAKKLIEDDKMYFEKMSDWLVHASELQEAISEVLKIDIVKEIADAVKDFVNKAMEILKDSARKKFIREKLSKIVREVKLVQNSFPYMCIVTVITVLVAIFLLLLHPENRLVFDCASLTIRSILGIASLVDNSMDAFRLSTIFAGNATVAKNFARAVTRGAVASVGMALDVLGIIFTSVDINKGSLSPEAKKIKEAVANMIEEAEVLDRVYNSVTL